jgi:hypothetical protein
MRSRALTAVLLLLVACVPKASTVAKPEDSAAGLPGPEITYYRGVSTVVLAGGQMVGTIDLLMKRTVDPNQSMITEQTVQKSSKQGEKPTEYTSSMKVSGSRFTVVESTLGIRAEGELIGEPWRWNAWTSHATLSDESSIDSAFSRSPNGMKADKRVSGPLGVLRVTLTESYQLVTAETFEKERREMLGLPLGTPDAGAASEPQR